MVLCKKNRLKTRKMNIYPYLFVSPFFISYFVFVLFTVFFSLFLSLTKWNGIGSMEFIGVDNYVRMLFDDPRFFITLKNTFIIMIFVIPGNLLLATFISYFLVQKTTSKKHFFRMANYIPAITTPVAVGLIFSILFDWQNGAVNSILIKLGVTAEPLYWLGQVWSARMVLIILLIWKGFGGATVLLSAALANIPEELIEAATIDGAGPITIYRKISLPVISPVIVFLVITSLIGGFQLFDEPSQLFSGGMSGSLPYGGPDRSCLTMVMNLYEEAFTNLNFGYSASLSYGMFLVISIFSFVSLKLMTRRNG